METYPLYTVNATGIETLPWMVWGRVSSTEPNRMFLPSKEHAVKTMKIAYKWKNARAVETS